MGKETINATMDPSIVAEIKKQAEKENRNLSNMLEVMAEKYLKGIKAQ